MNDINRFWVMHKGWIIEVCVTGLLVLLVIWGATLMKQESDYLRAEVVDLKTQLAQCALKGATAAELMKDLVARKIMCSVK